MTKLPATVSLLTVLLLSFPSNTPAIGETACVQEVAALPPAARSGRIFFADHAAGWLVGGNRLWRTVDAGRTWTPIHLPTPPPGDSAGLLDTHFFDALRGWIWFAQAAFTTENAGRSWTTRPLPTESHQDLRKVWFAADGQRGWAGGARYLPTRERPLYLPGWLAYEDEPGVWMVAKAVLQHTADGGEHWSARSSCDSCKPLGVGAIGWAHACTDVYDLPFSYRRVMPFHFDPDGRVKDGMFRLRAEQSISVASLFARVSSFFALITQ